VTKRLKLVGAAEIEEKFGVNRMQIYRLLKAGDFPEPAADLAHGRVWDEAVIAKVVKALKEAGRINADGFVVPWRFIADHNYTRQAALKRKIEAASAA
jgi:predicted DNA-binding transcriptional regulator AlpA